MRFTRHLIAGAIAAIGAAALVEGPSVIGELHPLDRGLTLIELLVVIA
jgi:hypothetical protein